MNTGLHRFRLYDLLLTSDVSLSLSPAYRRDSDGLAEDQIWHYEEGPVEPSAGELIHDVLDFDGCRRLVVRRDQHRGLVFSHGQTRVEWNATRRMIRLDAGADLDTRPGIVLERMVAPIAFILQREGHVALHASAVGDDHGGAWIFIGDSGAGKSTTALELLRRGLHLLADDLVIVDGHSHRLLKAMPAVRLFDHPQQVPEAVDRELVLPEIEKYWYQLPDPQRPSFDNEVRAIFSLDPDDAIDAPRLEQLKGRQAIVGVVSQAFDLTEAHTDWRALRFRILCQLIRTVPVYRVTYPRSSREEPVQVDAVAKMIERGKNR